MGSKRQPVQGIGRPRQAGRGGRALVAVVLVASIGASVVSTGLSADSAAAATNVSAVFVKLLPRLLATHVPLYLPTVFPGMVKSRLHVSLAPAQNNAYEVDISTVANCNGADACNWAWVSGEPAPKAFTFPTKDVSVSLGAHIKGEYSPGSCGASCTGVSVDWVVGRYLYSFGGNMDRAQVVALARSAVAAR